ncbi:MAG: SagB/ThcOx family dehydrogenase [Desulfobacteraceae bacterium]|nr:MAG: SagB/ThcOx family dehydrogenase [Desulfobacteraceae bacterium]
MKLPPPRTEGALAVEQAIMQRRTVRSFRSQVLRLDHFAQLLWAAQGRTGGGHKRAAPSAGALFPMDLYAVTGSKGVESVTAGIYHYQPNDHRIVQTAALDQSDALARASLSQMWMAKAPLQLVITADFGRVTGKYGRRGIRYAHIEAGHIGQNIFLQAEALGLKAGIVGAFDDAEVKQIMGISGSCEPLLLMPVGFAA